MSRESQKVKSKARQTAAPRPASASFGRLTVGAVLGAVLLYAIGQGVGTLILPRLRDSLYWSSWYYLVPDLVAPIGALVGALSARYKIVSSPGKANDSRNAPSVFIGSGIVVIGLLIWFLLIVLNNEIVQKFVLNPNGWVHNPLPSTTVWFFSYYGLPFIWSLVLMWRCRPETTKDLE